MPDESTNREETGAAEPAEVKEEAPSRESAEEETEKSADEGGTGAEAAEEAGDASGPAGGGEEETAAEEAEEEETGASGEDDGDQEEGKDRKMFFRRDKKKIAKLEEEIGNLRDRHLRTLAEYENFRKRTEREKSDIYTYAVRDAMTKLLPVMDNLERGIAALPEDSADDPIAEGMRQICKQFGKALEDIGVKPMDAEGKPFDPNLHQAVMHVEDPNLDKNVVAQELLKGYTYRDTVVRHAMVSVAN